MGKRRGSPGKAPGTILHTVNSVGKKGEIFPEPGWLPVFRLSKTTHQK